MGVDTHIMLSPATRVRDVATVMSILCGHEPVRTSLSADGAWCATVPNGFRVTTTTVPEMVRISGTSWGEERSVFYHFECEFPNGDPCRLLMPRATPLWIAVGVALVKFFGGRVDFCDCDERRDDVVVPVSPGSIIAPEGGQPWRDFQERLMHVQPLRYNEVMLYSGVAAYKVMPEGMPQL